jgi:hypothetical protein
MSVRSGVSAVALLALLSATAFLFGGSTPAEAHGAVTFPKYKLVGSHHHKTPPVQPVPAPVDNVKDFGAKGDSITDDTNAIQSAANDAANNHRSLFFPAGTYVHNGALTFNGIVVNGVGANSILKATNEDSCAVVLTGTSPSLNNMEIWTYDLTEETSDTPLTNLPNEGNVFVYNATGFAVHNLTLVQGQHFAAVVVANSSVAMISGNTFYGTASLNDTGVWIDNSSYNVTVYGNVFQNEDYGVNVSNTGAGSGSQFIAVIGNSIGATHSAGVAMAGVNTLDINQNAIQMADASSSPYAISVQQCNNVIVSQNSTSGGVVGINAQQIGPGQNSISENTIRNPGTAAIFSDNASTTLLYITGNLVGECGLTDTGSSPNNAVIDVTGADASGATTFVQNNCYQGHQNGLDCLVTCTFTTPHIPPGNVSGNTQTQTTLPNSI